MRDFIRKLLSALFVFAWTRKVETIEEFVVEARDKNTVSVSVIAMFYTHDDTTTSLYGSVMCVARIKGTKWVVFTNDLFQVKEKYTFIDAWELYILVDRIFEELQEKLGPTPVGFDKFLLPGAVVLKPDKSTRKYLLRRAKRAAAAM